MNLSTFSDTHADVTIYAADSDDFLFYGDAYAKGGALAVGDLNGDGRSDIVLGAGGADGPGGGRRFCGGAYVIYGAESPGQALFESLAGDYGAVADQETLLNFVFNTAPGDSRPMAFSDSVEGIEVLSPGTPTVVIGEEGVRAFFVRRSDHQTACLTYTPQFSTDLVSWETGTAPPSILADDGVHQIVCVLLPELVGGSSLRSFRVVVSLIR